MSVVAIDFKKNISDYKNYTLFNILESNRITSKEEYFTSDEIYAICRNKYFRNYGHIDESKFRRYVDNVLLNFTRAQIEIPDFKTMKSLSSYDVRSFMARHRCLHVLGFHIFSGRIVLDNDINIMGIASVQDVLTNSNLKDIEKAISHLNYTDRTYISIKRFLLRVIIITQKKLHEITVDDLKMCYRDKQDSAVATFNILKFLGYINKDQLYDRVQDKSYITEKNKIDFKKSANLYVYNEWITTVKEMHNNNNNKIKIVKQFFNWLETNHSQNSINDLSYAQTKEFVEWVKNYINPNTNQRYSRGTVATRISAWTQFVDFIIQNSYVSNSFKKEYYNNSKYSLEKVPTNLFIDVVPEDDRIAIEEIIYSMNPEMVCRARPYIQDILKIIYLCALRPMEAINLKLDCIKGSKELPSLHIHKSKTEQERYIPLVQEAYDIIKKYQKLNKNSNDIYAEHDNLYVKRLFSYRNHLINRNTINRALKRQMIEYGLVNSEGKAKYDGYILRKIRISIWIESGLTAEEVAKLAGHGDVNSQNAYYVGKEFRLDNLEKVYVKFYGKLWNQINSIGAYEPEEESIFEDDNYIADLQNTLMEIENKTINRVAMEEIYHNQPEFFFPLMDGQCGALAIHDEDFTCDKLQFKCLECEDLAGCDNFIDRFDKYLLDIFKARNMYIKNGLDGLVVRTDAMIEKLRQFYIDKLLLCEKEMDLKFKNIEKNAVIKRGRKRGS